MSVWFIRHAKTEMAGRFCGHTDPEVNAEGRLQIQTLVRELAGETIGIIYSSDLRRARSTAEAIACERKVPVVLRPALREIYFGAWEGLEWQDVERIDPEYAQRWMAAYPQLPAASGESFQDFTARVLTEVDGLIHDHHHDHRGDMAVVTHGGVLRIILQQLCGYSEAEAWQETQSYCCVVQHQRQATGEAI